MRALQAWRIQGRVLQMYVEPLSASHVSTCLPSGCSVHASDQFHQSCLVDHKTSTGHQHPKSSIYPAVLRARQFATSAEFSGGTFTAQDAANTSEPEQDELPDDKHMLLEAALGFINERGWTRAALVAGAQHIGLSPAIIGLLPRGAAELVEYHNEKCMLELADLLQARQASWQQIRTMQRVREGVKLRLEMNIPYIDSWAQALSLQSQPRNVSTALKQLTQVTDDIWHAAGDKSTDYNWYTKRGLLAAVYSSTELYMLTDYSPGYADTWEVLDRQLENVVQMGKLIGQTKSSAATLAQRVSKSLVGRLQS